MEREVQVKIQDQKEREKPEREGEREYQLADIVYIFYDKEEKGLMFYDRTEPHEVQEGVYETDIYSVKPATWDERDNFPNESKILKTGLGPVKVTTIMVSEQKYFEIMNSIQTKEERQRIVIDTRELNKINTSGNNYDNYSDIDFKATKCR